MIPTNITREHVIRALEEIDACTIPQGRKSTKFVLVYNGRRYPPKYVISLANKFVNGEELNPSEFSGGQETNNFLKGLGFDIEEITSKRMKERSKTPQNEAIETTQKNMTKDALSAKILLKECSKRFMEL